MGEVHGDPARFRHRAGPEGKEPAHRAGGPRGASRARAPRGLDAGVSPVLASLMLTMISLVLMSAYAQYLGQIQPRALPRSAIELGFVLEPGASLWGTGDESVVIVHRGGKPLLANATSVEITIDGVTSVHLGASLGPALADGRLTVGERVAIPRTIPPRASVDIEVVVLQPTAHVLSSSRLHAGAKDCALDAAPPEVAFWNQDPIDLVSSVTGDVPITVSVADACAGVDPGSAPHLLYRLGADPEADAGAMTWLGAATWRAAVPEPVGGWSSRVGETLTYRVSPLLDLNGNTGSSLERTDLVDPPAGGTLTYVSSYTSAAGTMTDFSAAQNGTDGGAEATLQEVASTPDVITSEMYGTAHSSSGATAPGNATGSPNNAHATLPADKKWVGVSGFTTFTGTISRVEMAAEAHYTGTASDTEDALTLAYTVGGSPGATTQSYALSSLTAGSDGPAKYVDVTADRAWTWSAVSTMMVKATYDKQGPEDDVDFHVDALWVRIEYTGTDQNLSVRMEVAGVPAGASQTLELDHRVVSETFEVHVWNWVAGTWTQRGSALVETSPAGWLYGLAADEMSGAGDVRVRFVDTGSAGPVQGSLHLGHVRVRTA